MTDISTLIAEVQRLRADYDRQAAEIAAVYVALGADSKTIVRYKASVLVQRLRADLEEQHLTLAAEQGRQEGAPSAGWEPCYGMLDRWRKNAGRDNFGNTVWLFAERINTASNSTTNRWRISRVLTRGGPAPNSGSTPEGFYRTARAAMLAADAVKP